MITGHQDSRVNQGYDILVSSNGTTFTSLSDGSTQALGTPGAGFAYTPSNGTGGAASSTVTSTTSGFIATNVKYVEFVTTDSGNGVYRELAVYVPEPSSVTLVVLGGVGLLGGIWRRRRSG